MNKVVVWLVAATARRCQGYFLLDLIRKAGWLDTRLVLIFYNTCRCTLSSLMGPSVLSGSRSCVDKYFRHWKVRLSAPRMFLLLICAPPALLSSDSFCSTSTLQLRRTAGPFLPQIQGSPLHAPSSLLDATFSIALFVISHGPESSPPRPAADANPAAGRRRSSREQRPSGRCVAACVVEAPARPGRPVAAN